MCGPLHEEHGAWATRGSPAELVQDDDVHTILQQEFQGCSSMGLMKQEVYDCYNSDYPYLPY